MQRPPSGGTWVGERIESFSVALNLAIIRTCHTTGRVSRCLKPTVWTVERSVSGVLYISSLLRNLKLPKRKGISNADFRVESPLVRGSPHAATSTRFRTTISKHEMNQPINLRINM
ncbi:hypothetical protein V1477_002908 [Vespula maculifrons]|uniref:Uncharacterized protein n=1 Tax=Vespula maculifrons TaxID=7453 RepID=A0ABD2CX94_VESMC